MILPLICEMIKSDLLEFKKKSHMFSVAGVNIRRNSEVRADEIASLSRVCSDLPARMEDRWMSPSFTAALQAARQKQWRSQGSRCTQFNCAVITTGEDCTTSATAPI